MNGYYTPEAPDQSNKGKNIAWPRLILPHHKEDLPTQGVLVIVIVKLCIKHFPTSWYSSFCLK